MTRRGSIAPLELWTGVADSYPVEVGRKCVTRIEINSNGNISGIWIEFWCHVVRSSLIER